MNRMIKALGTVMAIVLFGCSASSEQPPPQKTAALDAQAQGFTATTNKAKCPYPGSKCATIDASGGESYCRIDEGSNFAVREIVSEAQFETNMDVPITLHPGDGTNGHCNANAKLQMRDIVISIKREPGGGFDMNAGGVIGHVHLETVTSTVGRTHWLKGSNELQLDKFDYAVYLLDEPQGEPIILKHYRLEIFDKDCQSHMPVENINFGSKAKFGCTADTTEKGHVVAHEATSGDGYEPKR